MVDLGDIVRAVGDRYLASRATTPFQRKALRAIGRCRTEAMGSIDAVCEECGREHRLYRSCRNRHCPRCQAGAREAWLEARTRELLPVPYFHVVFTVPEMLNPIALYCPEVFYAALLQAAGNALLDVGRSQLHANLGVLTILHTWGQNLSLHPHAHCVVPGGGFSADGQRWIAVRKPEYLLPVRVLSRRFRTLLCQALREAAESGGLERLPRNVPPHLTIEGAGAQEWVVYAKPPFAGPEQVLGYLSRYTHRVAISNRRIISLENDQVTFAWRDYADESRMKQTTIEAGEFLRRFLLHVLPDRFVRIRYFGFLSNGRRARSIERVRQLIGHVASHPVRERPKPAVLCPSCQALRYTRQQQERTVRPPPGEEAA
jgi:hypothetical protein